MIFASFALAEAEGAILAHGLRLPGGALKKGRRLSIEDIERLGKAGIERVIVARLEAGDVGEDEAADRIAAALAGPNLAKSRAFTGRCNLHAEAHGLAVFDPARLDRLNRVDEAVTVAALPVHSVVRPREMVATVKIIPFAVPGPVIEECLGLAAEGGPMLGVAPFKHLRAGLIQTALPGLKESVLDGTTAVTRARLEALDATLVAERRCRHDEAEIADAVRALRAQGCDLVLIFGASATVDRRDVAPAGVVRAGGRVVHFGMPVDPGNLILLAAIGETPVVVMPGCARSPKENGFDWVLDRLVAGLAVTPRDIMDMGSRGLLKEIPARPLPRARADRGPAEGSAKAGPRGARVAAVVLAAGQSRRMGARNKLLAEVGGAPMIARTVDAVLATRARPVIVVTGHEAEKVRSALAGRAVGFVHNPDFAAGLSTSLRRGIEAVEALADPVAGALVALGDMPLVAPAEIERLIAAFDPAEGRAICLPAFRGKRGNPVLWAREFFAEMKAVAGDVGAKHLLGEHEDKVCEVAVDSEAPLTDIDTAEELAHLAAPKGE